LYDCCDVRAHPDRTESRLELRNLRAFIAVVDYGHFGRAATFLNLTQPALTQRIQALEREVGQQLLNRDAREVRLTEAGAVLLTHARALIQTEDRALREVKDYLAGITGRLRISYLTLWDGALPTTILTEFRRRHPDIKLELTSGYSQPNIDRLLAGDLDFAFVGAAIGGSDRIEVRPLDQHEIVVIMAPTHPLAQLESVPVDRLRGVPMIGVSSGVNGPLVSALHAWFTNATGERPNIIRAEPPDQMAAAVAESENVVALMSRLRAGLARNDGLVFRTLVPTPIMEYGFAYARDARSPALTKLLEVVSDVAPPLERDLPPGTELISAGSH
jgi:DNA-binding transcriptional LysR family regulator